MSIKKYGLEAFGVTATTKLNNLLASAISSIYPEDKEAGAKDLSIVIDELYQKLEAIDGGHHGFMMYTASGTRKEQRDQLTKKVFDILSTQAGWHYSAILTNDRLIPA